MSVTGSASRLLLGRIVPTVMFDSVTIVDIPRTAKAVAGYVDGTWQTYHALEGHYRHVVSIAVSATHDAHALDIETGDATIPEAAAWFRRQLEVNPVGFRPIFYVELSKAQTLVNELKAGNVARDRYRLWTAHYTYKPHRCSLRCGNGFHDRADATQWTNKALGRNLDESLLSIHFFHRR